MEDYSGLPGLFIQCKHKGSCKREARESESEKGPVTTEPEVDRMYFEDGRRGIN